MKNIDLWRPTKFIYKKNRLIAARTKDVTISSRLSADLIAYHYDTYLTKEHVRGKLVDLGCGKVPLYATYKNLVSEITCVDWQNPHYNNPFLDYTCDLNELLPFENEAFDTIILSDVLEHILKPEQLWREMTRILKPGGKLIMNVPFFYKLHEVPYDYFRYTEFALTHFAQSNKLKISLLKPTGGVPEILADVVAKNVLFIPLIGKVLAVGVQKMCHLFLKTGIGKQLSRKTGKHFPFGYFMISEKIS